MISPMWCNGGTERKFGMFKDTRAEFGREKDFGMDGNNINEF